MDRPPPGTRATFFVAALASAIGLAGVVNGVRAATALAAPDPVAAVHGHGEIAAANDALLYALFDAAHLRALGAINAVVSLLLVFASFTLLARRPTAPWWMTQAALANAAHALLQCTFVAIALKTATSRFSPLIARVVAAQSPGTPPPTMPAGQDVAMVVVGFAMVTMLLVLVYLGLAWRAGRPDIRATLRPPEETPS